MATLTTAAWPRSLALGIGGPAVIGAALGLAEGPAGLAARAAELPAIVLCIGLVMLPALYIGAAFLGLSPEPKAVAAAARDSIAAVGTVLLGLAPALAFLVAASTRPPAARLLGWLVLGAAALIGVRALYVRLFERVEARAFVLFAAWSAVGLGIGARLLVEVLPL